MRYSWQHQRPRLPLPCSHCQTLTSACSCKTGTRERPRRSPPTSACPSGLTTTQQFVLFGSCSPKRQRLHHSRLPWRGGQLHAEGHRAPDPRRPGTQPSLPGLTDGQFPYMLRQTQALSVTLPNRRLTIFVQRISNGHSRPSAAYRCCSTAISSSYRPPEMHHCTRKSPRRPTVRRF